MCPFEASCLENLFSTEPLTSRTALHLAARHGNEECVAVLVKEGSNIEAEDKDRKTPIALAAWMGHCNVIRILMKVGARKEMVDVKNLRNVDDCLKGKNAMQETT